MTAPQIRTPPRVPIAFGVAACHGHPLSFSDVRGGTSDEPIAKAVCARCTIRDACLTEALALALEQAGPTSATGGTTTGIWGGTTSAERRAILRRT